MSRAWLGGVPTSPDFGLEEVQLLASVSACASNRSVQVVALFDARSQP